MMEPPSGDGWQEGKTLIDSMTDDIETIEDEAQNRLERGTAVERYVVLYELGTGGMGVVYAAYDPELDRKVALKLLHAHSRSERARSRLLREAKSIARLTHPNVVTVHDVGTYEGRVFVAMEYVHGVTFREWMQQAVRSPVEVLQVLLQAGRGLAAAHKADLVHRDFKPDNILVEQGGRAVVLDFGLARRTNSREDIPELDEAVSVIDERNVNLTRTGAKLGTPAYMAPEQHLGVPTDSRTDQFSFCVVLWEALYGQRPFRGATPRETALSVLKGVVVEPPPADVPAPLRRVLQRGLSTDPENRFLDMRSLLSALVKAPRKRRPLWVAGGILAAGGVVGGTMALAQITAVDDTCEGGAARWNDVWDGGARAQVRTAFVDSGAKFAAAAWTGVEGTLDRYTQRWSDVHRDACEATHVHHEQTEAMLDLRMACLRSRHHAVVALLREFSDADPAVVEHAVDAVNSLPRLHECSDADRLAVRLATPLETLDTPDTAPLRDLLVDARAKEISARFEPAQTLVRRVLVDAQELGAHAVVAEAHLRDGSISERRSDFEQAERSFLEAVWAAQRARRPAVEAEAWVRLVWTSGVERFDPERGHLWAEFARGAMNRAGGNPTLEAQLRHNVGGVLYTEMRYDEALREYRLALDQQRALLGDDDPQVAATLNHIGNALMESHRYAESEEFCARSLTLRQTLFGDQHPKVAASLNNLGELEKKQGHAAAALVYAERSLSIVGNSGGREEDIAVVIKGWALRELGRGREAMAAFRRARALRLAEYGPRAPRVADVELELALTRAAMGDLAEARVELDRLIALESTRRPDVASTFREFRAALP